MSDTEQNRKELLEKLHSRMNQRKMGRMNRTHKEQTMNKMKEKLVGDNPQMSDVFDKVVTKTKKNLKKKSKDGCLSNQDALKNLEKNLGELN